MVSPCALTRPISGSDTLPAPSTENELERLSWPNTMTRKPIAAREPIGRVDLRAQQLGLIARGRAGGEQAGDEREKKEGAEYAWHRLRLPNATSRISTRPWLMKPQRARSGF